jgi:CDP-diacylglycerol--glycerol-3-phosphate 3-phosphatidyltransferase
MFPINLPNVLTVLRILLVPVVVVALLGETPNGDLLAAVVFAFASVTDWVDGYLARSRGSITTFGKLMDPIADKLLVVAALVSLVSLDRLQAWVAMVIIARELAVTMSRMAATGQGVVIAANRWGKVKTALQVLTIFLLIAVSGSPTWLDVLVYATVVVTVISGVEYFFGLRRTLNAAKERDQARAAPRSPQG